MAMSDRMKVVMMATFLDPDNKAKAGGLSIHAFELSKSLSKSGDLDLTLVTYGDSNKIRLMEGYRFIMIKKGHSYKYLPLIPLLRLMRVMQKEKPDVVHIQGTTFTYFLLYSLAFVPRRTPRVATVHGRPAQEGIVSLWWSESSLKAKLIGWGEGQISRRFDLILCVTARLRDEWKTKFGAHSKADYQVITNGVDPDRYRETGPEASRTKPDAEQLVVVSAKELIPPNGQEYLISAFPAVVRKVPSARLLMAGEGTDRARLQRIAAETGVNDRIGFLGRIANKSMPEFLSRASVFVAPSVRMEQVEDGSSIVVLEAMASGIPVVASNVGGLKDIIVDGKTGVLVPERDPGAIASAILDLYNHPEKARAMGQEGRRYVLREMTWDQLALRHRQLYCDMLAKRRH